MLVGKSVRGTASEGRTSRIKFKERAALFFIFNMRVGMPFTWYRQFEGFTYFGRDKWGFHEGDYAVV